MESVSSNGERIELPCSEHLTSAFFFRELSVWSDSVCGVGAGPLRVSVRVRRLIVGKKEGKRYSVESLVQLTAN
ncbi:unnamed protein product [Onchocerca ochengi]|uniref:Uncharacterized protein n=1 Tax=Onchocerca ochengi TaxID=42157 RepID=A0A182DZP8_ONCOC|nr:unnamed protein product [Onchocerca ochengi]